MVLYNFIISHRFSFRLLLQGEESKGAHQSGKEWPYLQLRSASRPAKEFAKKFSMLLKESLRQDHNFCLQEYDTGVLHIVSYLEVNNST